MIFLCDYEKLVLAVIEELKLRVYENSAYENIWT
jgi:hypothetical protein